MEDTDKKLLEHLKNSILNDIHVVPNSPEAYSRFRQKQLKAIKKYCTIWCNSHGYANTPFNELPFNEKWKSLLFARESMSKDNSWQKE